MYLLFAGLTFLIAHVFIFSGREVQWFVQQFLATGLWLFTLSYAAAAVVVGIFFYFGKLHRRLPKPLSGRKLLFAGVTIYSLHLFLIYGGLLGYRPGLGMLMMFALYLPPIAMMFILVGAGIAFLDTEPNPLIKRNEV